MGAHPIRGAISTSNCHRSSLNTAAEADLIAVLDRIIATEVGSLAADGDDPLWALADQIALLRAADPGQLDLVRDLLAVLVRRAERGRATRAR